MLELSVYGFTGTQQGLTPQQRDVLEALFRNSAFSTLHHGDCIGADAEAHAIARTHGDFLICIHPPTDSRKRAWCVGDIYYDPLPYLDRNKRIVKACTRLLACPAEFSDVLRSGTWSTVRYARLVGKPYTLIYPDGSTERNPA